VVAYQQTLRKLKALGVTIALDDFGTGYSSLSRLNSFHFDRIKIDRSFIDIAQSAEAGAVIVAIQTLAHAIGVETTAEGVETDEQLQLLREIGVNCVQGFLLARPMPADQLRFDRTRDAARKRVSAG